MLTQASRRLSIAKLMLSVWSHLGPVNSYTVVNMPHISCHLSQAVSRVSCTDFKIYMKYIFAVARETTCAEDHITCNFCKKFD